MVVEADQINQEQLEELSLNINFQKVYNIFITYLLFMLIKIINTIYNTNKFVPSVTIYWLAIGT
jgi:hypothetical protein